MSMATRLAGDATATKDKVTDSSDVSGVKWTRNLWGLEPRWTVDPIEENVRTTVQKALGINGPSNIRFLTQGAFNKLYIIDFQNDKPAVIARVALPVEPKWKTLSEVATLDWVRRNTSLPVPRVLGYDADRLSLIGFEWIAIEYVPADALATVWQDIEFPSKQAMVRQIALYCSETFRKQFRGIGNLFAPSKGPHDSVQRPSTGLTGQMATEQESLISQQLQHGFQVQRIVSGAFINGRRRRADPNFGPFASSRDWLLAKLEHSEADCRVRSRKAMGQRATASFENEYDDRSETAGSEEAIVQTERHCQPDVDIRPVQVKECDSKEDDSSDSDAASEDDAEEIQECLEVISRLRSNLDKFFPAVDGATEPEPTMVFHDDMNSHNILVDKDGQLAGVVDWECVSALPLHTACDYPPFIQGKPVTGERPNASKYQRDERGELPELYADHLKDWEKARLRECFLVEMRKFEPGWVEVFAASQHLRDFDLAVESCDDPFMTRQILSWLKDVEEKGICVMGLEERIDNGCL